MYVTHYSYINIFETLEISERYLKTVLAYLALSPLLHLFSENMVERPLEPL